MSADVVSDDARVFLGRLTRLNPGAVVRLRPVGADRTALWAYLPWRVLVTREVPGAASEDRTVVAAALLAEADAGPPRRDSWWRWPLPPHSGEVVEEIPAGDVWQVAAAAAGTLREVTETGLAGRAVGARVLRDALLDHVAIVVETPSGRTEVPQRLIQAVVQMGFLGPAQAPGTSRATAAPDPVRVRRADAWVGLAARYGTAWLPPAGPLAIRPARG